MEMKMDVNHRKTNLSSSKSIFLLLASTLLNSACDTGSTDTDRSSSEVTLSVTSPMLSYSSVDELVDYSYLVTNTGTATLNGPVTINDNRMTVSCPELFTVGNNDAALQPNESVACTSFYTVTQADLSTESIESVAVATVGGISSKQGRISVKNTSKLLFIFPFDTADPSVVFRSTLTSAGAIVQAGGIEEVGSANEFDSVLGMKPTAGISGAPGCRFTISSIPELASMPSGQLSIEVEREWLAVTDPEVGSSGYDHDDIEYLVSYGSADASTLGRLYMQPDENLLSQFMPQEDTRRALFVSTNQSERFARVTLSWEPDEASLYVDGLLMGKIQRTNQESTRFANIYIGTLGGVLENSFDGNYYVRNLIVANKSVKPSTQRLLRHVMQIGDSFSAGQPLMNVATKYDGTISNTIIRELFMSEFGYEKYTVYSNGGGKIQDASDDPLELDVTNGSGKTRAEALMEDPSLVVFITGGNDLGIFQSDQFRNDLRDHVEAILGVNGHASTRVQHIIITTTTSNSQATSDALLTMRDIMLELPDWWDTKYPQFSNKVHVIDMWQLFGGANVDHSLFGIVDSIHPSASGNILYGRAISEEIMLLVR